MERERLATLTKMLLPNGVLKMREAGMRMRALTERKLLTATKMLLPRYLTAALILPPEKLCWQCWEPTKWLPRLTRTMCSQEIITALSKHRFW
jgi:hypothetical protein